MGGGGVGAVEGECWVSVGGCAGLFAAAFVVATVSTYARARETDLLPLLLPNDLVSESLTCRYTRGLTPPREPTSLDVF